MMNLQRLSDVTVVTFTHPMCVEPGQVDQLQSDLMMLVVGTGKVVLDFACVQFLPSAVLGVLIRFDKRAKMKSCRVRLCNLRADIAEVLQVTKLHHVFEILRDRASALHEF